MNAHRSHVPGNRRDPCTSLSKGNRHRLAAFLAGLFCTASMAQSVEIIPASPRFLEPVYARIKENESPYGCIYAAQVSMDGTVISVRYQRLIDLCGYDYDVELGRFPAGTYTVAVQGQAPVQFTVGASSSTPTAPYPGNQPVVNYSGMWWTPSESGWGMSISQGATNQVFAAWFVYGQSGEPVWYTLQPGSWTSSNVYSTYTGPIYKTTGPYFGGPFNPASAGVRQVGTGTLSFRYANRGMFSYVVEGVQGVKNIERMAIE